MKTYQIKLLQDIKDNKDITINDILIEEEHEDLSLKDKSTKNESNEFKAERRRKYGKSKNGNKDYRSDNSRGYDIKRKNSRSVY